MNALTFAPEDPTSEAPPTIEVTLFPQTEETTTQYGPKVDLLGLANLPAEDIEATTGNDRVVLQRAYVFALKESAPIEAEVRLYARLNDIYQVKVLRDLVPTCGDDVNPFYIEQQAYRMGLSKEDRDAIQAIQTGTGIEIDDTAFRALGKIAYPADMLSARYFRAQLDKLVANARLAGVPEETIKQILDEADLVVEKGDIGYKFYKWLTN